MNLKSLRLLALIFVVVLTAMRTVGQDDSWQKIAPVGHTFTVMMPTKATVVYRRIRVSDTESIPAILYYSISEGKRFVAAGFYKISADTAPTLSSYERFLSGMEHSLNFNAKLKALRFIRDLSLGGIRGKEYELRLAEYFVVARFLASDAGLYALFALSKDHSDREAERFLSSFRAGDVNTDETISGVANGEVVTLAPASKDSTTKQAPGEQPATPAKGVVALARPVEPPATDGLPPEPWPDLVGPITGGVINGKAIRLVQPEYPAAARMTHASGQVKVQIVINEVGNVTRAQVVEGAESLREAALTAARNSRFTPTLLMGQPVKVTGVLVYNFVAQ